MKEISEIFYFMIDDGWMVILFYQELQINFFVHNNCSLINKFQRGEYEPNYTISFYHV